MNIFFLITNLYNSPLFFDYLQLHKSVSCNNGYVGNIVEEVKSPFVNEMKRGGIMKKHT